MSEKFEIYKCEICGHVIEIVNPGVGELVCCGQNMNRVVEQNEEKFADKHKPVVVIEDNKVTVRVGEIPHPMTNEHYLYFIEAISNDGRYLKREYLKPEDVPSLSFICDCMSMKARALCNIHGLWETKV